MDCFLGDDPFLGLPQEGAGDDCCCGEERADCGDD